LNRSPARQLLFVSANLQEAWLEGDLAGDTDLENFARRVRTVVPYAPDALLLQEVSAQSSQRVARHLKIKTGFPFEVVVVPELKQHSVPRRIRDTAILINSKTMRAVDRGGFVDTHCSLVDFAPGITPLRKGHAYCLLRPARAQLRVAVMSVHFFPNERLAAPTLGWCYKVRWSQQVARQLEQSYPLEDQRHIRVIAVDFNNRRCLRGRETVGCDVLPFWYVMTKRLGYKDAVFDRHSSSNQELWEQSRKGSRVARRIDYVFLQGRAIAASHDINYDAVSGEPDFYSDHRLVWALVAP
jgi:hypothetical protein